jgi:hypothetical protein
LLFLVIIWESNICKWVRSQFSRRQLSISLIICEYQEGVTPKRRKKFLRHGTMLMNDQYILM